MAVEDRRNPPPSPCNFTCIVDRRRSCCVGCLRTLDEIAMWNDLSTDEQWVIVDDLPARRAKMSPHGPGSE